MGGLFARPTKLSITDINATINESILNVTSKTESNISAVNSIIVSKGGTISNVTQSIELNSSLSSLVNISQDVEMKSTITNNIVEELNKKSVALISDFGSILQNKNIDMSTNIGNFVKNSNITNVLISCATNQNLLNTIVNESSTVNNVNQNITGKFVQTCISDSDVTANTVSDIANSINQKADITDSNPLDFIGNMFKYLNAGIITVILIIIGGICFLFAGSEGTKKLEVVSKAANNAAALSILPV